jgi:hypothetical protein
MLSLGGCRQKPIGVLNSARIGGDDNNNDNNTPLLGIPQKDFRHGAFEFFVKYDYYDIFESRKISK